MCHSLYPYHYLIRNEQWNKLIYSCWLTAPTYNPCLYWASRELLADFIDMNDNTVSIFIRSEGSDVVDSTRSDDTTSDVENQQLQTHWIVDGFITETSRIRQWRRENFDDGDDEADVSDVTAVLSADSQQLSVTIGEQEWVCFPVFRLVSEYAMFRPVY